MIQVRDFGETSAPPVERATSPAVEKICYNTDSCTAMAKLELHEDEHYYDTSASGYYSTSVYDQSSKALLPD